MAGVDSATVGALCTLGGAALTFAGVKVRTAVAGRTAAAETAVQSAEVRSRAENTLIDQLQEQLGAQAARLTKYQEDTDARLVKLERERDGYRTYAHDLRGRSTRARRRHRFRGPPTCLSSAAVAHDPLHVVA